MMAKIKSFEDAVKSAILNNSGVEVSLPKEGDGKFDSLCGIGRSWEGWGNLISVRCDDDIDGRPTNCVFDGDYYIPKYCIEEVFNNADS